MSYEYTHVKNLPIITKQLVKVVLRLCGVFASGLLVLFLNLRYVERHPKLSNYVGSMANPPQHAENITFRS